MSISPRPYQVEDDYWRMRDFLRRVYLLNERREYSWHVSRLDYARRHALANIARLALADVATLWEDDGELVAFIMPDGKRGEAHLCFDPTRRSPELETEMLDRAEETLLCQLICAPRRATAGLLPRRCWSRSCGPRRGC